VLTATHDTALASPAEPVFHKDFHVSLDLFRPQGARMSHERQRRSSPIGLGSETESKDEKKCPRSPARFIA
jgi:hypothetical protein